MAKRHRFTAAVLAVLVLVTMTAALFIIAHEADHDCVGEDCPICAVISCCHNSLKTLSDAIAVFAVIVLSAGAAVSLGTLPTVAFRTETPILLKVKLLN